MKRTNAIQKEIKSMNRLFSKKTNAPKGKRIYVHDLGECVLTTPKDARGYVVSYLEENDGTKSWQLNPDTERGDRIIKTAKAIPLENLR